MPSGDTGGNLHQPRTNSSFRYSVVKVAKESPGVIRGFFFSLPTCLSVREMTRPTADFYETIIRTDQEARKFDYHGTRFRMMLKEYGGVETACRLLDAVDTQEGLAWLWERHRLDLAVEYHILQPRLHDLFDGSTGSQAARRLTDLHYFVDEDGNPRKFSNGRCYTFANGYAHSPNR